MVEEAWKVAFPSLRFPVKVIDIFPQPKPSLLVPLQQHQEEPQALTCQPTDNSNKLKVTINNFFKKERAFFRGLKKTLNNNISKPIQNTKHPQMSVIYQELLIVLACCTFLLEVKAAV
jgi:hypothetical protein